MEGSEQRAPSSDVEWAESFSPVLVQFSYEITAVKLVGHKRESPLMRLALTQECVTRCRTEAY